VKSGKAVAVEAEGDVAELVLGTGASLVAAASDKQTVSKYPESTVNRDTQTRGPRHDLHYHEVLRKYLGEF
jgi:hypothetical protein